MRSTPWCWSGAGHGGGRGAPRGVPGQHPGPDDLRTPMPESDFHSVEDVACPNITSSGGATTPSRYSTATSRTPSPYAWMEGAHRGHLRPDPHIVRRVIGCGHGHRLGFHPGDQFTSAAASALAAGGAHEPSLAWLTTQVGAAVSGWTSRRRPSTRSRHPHLLTWRRRWTATCA